MVIRYTWDPEKDALNKRKHGLSLADGISALEDPDRNISIDGRFDYGEVRIVTAGRGGGKVLIVVSTEVGINAEGEEIARIISVRKAKWYEEDWFDFGRT
ncbi:MAG: BrnT family toxin [Terracidiphilus sp.]|nr:BrnT family toxin [Terracidiphilus sp.]